MPVGRPRLPNGKAAVTGAIDQHPSRFKDRKQPKAKSIGKPPSGLTRDEIVAWHAFIYEAPWLASADRTVLRMACRLRVQVEQSKKINLSHYSHLSRLLSKLGCTPCDRSRVSASDDDTETADEAYFDSWAAS